MSVLSAVPAGCVPNRRNGRHTVIQSDNPIFGGVDTHGKFHVAAAVSPLGAVLETAKFPATRPGYEELHKWMTSHGKVERVGVEGTGSFGAGLFRHLDELNVEVREVNRPNRQARRRNGKSDTADAINAARQAIVDEETSTPKSRKGNVESMRVLRIPLESFTKARTTYINQVKDILVTAPNELRSELKALNSKALLTKCSRFRDTNPSTVVGATKLSLKSLADKCLETEHELELIEGALKGLVIATNVSLLSEKGAGVDVASTLLVVAGDNPERLKSEASLAALCGVSPIDASSGNNQRQRLNRGGDRRGNRALHCMALCRVKTDPATIAYVARRKAEGKTHREIMRCIKRYLARRVFQLLTIPEPVPDGRELKARRTALELTLRQVEEATGIRTARLSEIDRLIRFDAEAARSYEAFLDLKSVA